jgi:hypothetical protein
MDCRKLLRARAFGAERLFQVVTDAQRVLLEVRFEPGTEEAFYDDCCFHGSKPGRVKAARLRDRNSRSFAFSVRAMARS